MSTLLPQSNLLSHSTLLYLQQISKVEGGCLEKLNFSLTLVYLNNEAVFLLQSIYPSFHFFPYFLTRDPFFFRTFEGLPWEI